MGIGVSSVLGVPGESAQAQSLSGAQESFYRDLAEFHAPVVVQETGKHPKADALARYDFDGDRIADNNWDNLDHYPTPAWGYYEVLETRTHFYITYAFFHPRDYSRFCVKWICHENDLEGVIFAVDKSRGAPFGKVVLIETLAHDTISTHTSLVRSPQGKVAIFIESGGHGISGSGRLDRSQDRRLLYTYGGVADDPKGARSGEYSYDLLPIKREFWDRIRGTEKDQMFVHWFDHRGSRLRIDDLPAGFAGRKYGVGRARPPWGWMDTGNQELKRGEWFLDPAYSIGRKLRAAAQGLLLPLTNLLEPFRANAVAQDYVHHPYLSYSRAYSRD